MIQTEPGELEQNDTAWEHERFGSMGMIWDVLPARLASFFH